MDKIKALRYFIVIVALSMVLITMVSLKGSLAKVLDLNIKSNDLALSIELKQFKSQGKLSEQEALDYLSKVPFDELNGTPLPFGEEANYHQLFLRNVSSQNKEIVIFIDNPTLNSIEVFDVSSRIMRIIGLGREEQQREGHLLAIPHLEVNLDTNESKSLLFKVRSEGSPNFPILVFEKEDFNRYKTAIYFLWGVFIAISMITVVYNLVLYAGSKEPLYLVYVGYVLLFLIVLSVIHGFSWFLFPDGLVALFSDNLIFFYYWLGICLTLFTYYFLGIHKKHSSVLRKATIGAVSMMGVLSITALFMVEYKSAQLFFPLQTVIYVLCICMVITNVKGNARWAIFYIISWFPLLISAGVGTLLMIGEIEYTFWTRHATMLGVLFEVALISLALAERIRVRELNFIYQTSHDEKTGLPNKIALNHALQSKLIPGTMFTLVLFEASDEALGNSETKLSVIAQDVTDALSQNLLILNVEEQYKAVGSFILSHNQFCIVVLSDDSYLLENSLSKLIADTNLFYAKKSGVSTSSELLNAFVFPHIKKINFDDLARSIQFQRHFESAKVVRYFDDNMKKLKDKNTAMENLLLTGQLNSFDITFNKESTKLDNGFCECIFLSKDNELSFTLTELMLHSGSSKRLEFITSIVAKVKNHYSNLNGESMSLFLPLTKDCFVSIKESELDFLAEPTSPFKVLVSFEALGYFLLIYSLFSQRGIPVFLDLRDIDVSSLDRSVLKLFNGVFILEKQSLEMTPLCYSEQVIVIEKD